MTLLFLVCYSFLFFFNKKNKTIDYLHFNKDIKDHNYISRNYIVLVTSRLKNSIEK